MRYETHTCNVCFIIKLGHLDRMNHNSMDSNPKYATARWYSLAKTYKIVITQIFMMKNIKKNKKYHIFAPPRPPGSGGAKIWYFLFFFKKYKIGNKVGITILDSVNVNDIMPTTIFCSKPTNHVPGRSVAHVESPWTLKITPILRSASRDLILALKLGFITILYVFANAYLHEVVYLGLEFIGLWSIYMKYMYFLMIHIQHVWSSHPIIRWQLPPRFSCDPSEMTIRHFLIVRSM